MFCAISMATTKAKTVVTGAADVVATAKVGLPDKVEVVVQIHYAHGVHGNEHATMSSARS